MIKEWYSKLPDWAKNKYSITLLIFFTWLFFFDQNDLITQYKFKSELGKLRKQKTYYKKQIEVTRKDLENLLNDNEKLERFAREKYLMKKKDEDIFVIVIND